MSTISLKVSDTLLQRVENFAKEIDRNKSYIIRQALEEYLENREDYLIALARLAKEEKTYTIEEVEQDLDLAN